MSLEIGNIRPRGRRILISRPQPVEGNERVVNGIIIPPKSFRDKQYGMIGTVLAVGEDVDECISPGAQVIIGEFSGIPLYDGVQETPYWIVGEGEVMAYVG